MQENNNLDIISEKILQEKIKFLVWNSKIDIIIICYDQSYELQRLGYKHEEIFKKEEKCEILDIKFIEDKEIIAVFLKDKTINFVEYSKGEFLLKHKFSKSKNFSASKMFDLNKKESKNFSSIFNFSEGQNYFANPQNTFTTEIFNFENLKNFYNQNNDSNEYNNISNCPGDHYYNNHDDNINTNNKDDECNNYNYLIDEINKQNPFFKDLTFNSFSKIDISYLNFLNGKFDFTPSLIFDKTNTEAEIDISLGYLIKIGSLSLKSIAKKNSGFATEIADVTGKIENKNIFDVKFLEKNNFIILESEQQSAVSGDISLNFNFLCLNLLSRDYADISLYCYLIFNSIQIIEYVNNILGIFSKIFYKLGMTFFDKYIFANGLEHEINSENEPKFKEALRNQLKTLFYLGTWADNKTLKNFFEKDLFEGNSLSKLDESMHFNLKNIEDILIENVKPCINTLIFNYNQIQNLKKGLNVSEKNAKSGNIKIEANKNIPSPINEDESNIHFYCENIYNKFEQLLIEINETKTNYRNFLSWLYSFNPAVRERDKNPQESNINPKSVLLTHQVDYNRLFYFINDTDYNMTNLIKYIENIIVKDHEINSQNELEIYEKEIVNSYKRGISTYDRFVYLKTERDPPTEAKLYGLYDSQGSNLINNKVLEKINFKIFKNPIFQKILLDDERKLQDLNKQKKQSEMQMQLDKERQAVENDAFQAFREYQTKTPFAKKLENLIKNSKLYNLNLQEEIFIDSINKYTDEDQTNDMLYNRLNDNKIKEKAQAEGNNDLLISNENDNHSNKENIFENKKFETDKNITTNEDNITNNRNSGLYCRVDNEINNNNNNKAKNLNGNIGSNNNTNNNRSGHDNNIMEIESNNEVIINNNTSYIHANAPSSDVKNNNNNNPTSNSNNDELISNLKEINKNFMKDLIKQNKMKENSLRNLLVELKDYYTNLNNQIIHKISNEISFENILKITGLNQKNVKRILWMDENPCYLPYFQNNEDERSKGKQTYLEKLLYIWYYDCKQKCFVIILLHFMFNILNKLMFRINKDLSFNIRQKNLKIEKLSFIKFPINLKNINIIDFCIHKNKNLIFLVKSIEEKSLNPNTGANISQSEETASCNVSNNKASNIDSGNNNTFAYPNKIFHNNNLKINEKHKTNATGEVINNNNMGGSNINNNNISSKSSNMNITNPENNARYTLIVSEISNYNFEEINLLENQQISRDAQQYQNPWANPLTLDIDIFNKTDAIKIDKLIDLDCSENSYVSAGKRSFISIIDIKKNKISILDL